MKKLIALLCFILFSACIYAQTVTINNQWIEYDVVQDGVKGIKIHVDFNIKDWAGKLGMVIVNFECPKGVALKDTNGKYSRDGKVSVSQVITPMKDDTHYKNLCLFMPTDEIHMMKGEHTYYCNVRVYSSYSSKKYLTGNNYLSFVGTSQVTIQRIC